MKILLINSCYEFGSTGSIVKGLRDYLVFNNVDTIVLYGRGNKSKDTNTLKTANDFICKAEHLIFKFLGLCYSGNISSTLRIIKNIKKEKPDLIHVHCTNDYFLDNRLFFSFLKKSRIKVLVTLHAEYFYTGNCTHSLDCNQWKTGCRKCVNFKKATGSFFINRTHKNWVLMNKNFAGFSYNNLYFSCVSDWLRKRAKQSKIISKYQIATIRNGINTNIFYFEPNRYILPELKECEKKILFSVPNFQIFGDMIKGCDIFLEIVKKCANYPFKFIVIGDNRYDFDFSKYNNLIYIGLINNKNKLRQIYSACDITLLTSRAETFSLVSAESLCCGTPVFGFQCGAPESIAIKDYSLFVPQKTNLDEFIHRMNEFLYYPFNRQEIATKAKIIYNFNGTAEKYFTLYKKITKV